MFFIYLFYFIFDLVNTLIKPLEAVLSNRNINIHLRVSALSILSTACQTCPTAMHSILWELTNWVLNILDVEKVPEIRRGKNKIKSKSKTNI